MKNDSRKGGGSPKGRRKLNFVEKREKLPLTGKSIFVDVKETAQCRLVKDGIKKLGARVDEFFHKDINYVITNNWTSRPDKNDALKSPESPSTVSTPSPFNCGPSPSPASGSKLPPESVTRGKAIAKRAITKETNPVLTSAEKLGIKIVTLDAAQKWIQREIAKLPQNSNKSKSHANILLGSCKVKKLKSPYLKIESFTKQYKVVCQQIDLWPHANVETPRGTCPFDGTTVGGEKSREDRGDRIGLIPLEPKTPETKSTQKESAKSPGNSKPSHKKQRQNAQRSSIIGGVRIVTAGELRRRTEMKRLQEKKKGYCECCETKYDDLTKHVREEQHKDFIREKKHYQDLDRLIDSGPSDATFLKRVLQQHCSIVSGIHSKGEKSQEKQKATPNSDQEVMKNMSKKTTLKIVNSAVKSKSRRSPRKIWQKTNEHTQSKLLKDSVDQDIRQRRDVQNSTDVDLKLEKHYVPARTRNFLFVQGSSGQHSDRFTLGKTDVKTNNQKEAGHSKVADFSMAPELHGQVDGDKALRKSSLRSRSLQRSDTIQTSVSNSNSDRKTEDGQLKAHHSEVVETCERVLRSPRKQSLIQQLPSPVVAKNVETSNKETADRIVSPAKHSEKNSAKTGDKLEDVESKHRSTKETHLLKRNNKQSYVQKGDKPVKQPSVDVKSASSSPNRRLDTEVESGAIGDNNKSKVQRNSRPVEQLKGTSSRSASASPQKKVKADDQRSSESRRKSLRGCSKPIEQVGLNEGDDKEITVGKFDGEHLSADLVTEKHCNISGGSAKDSQLTIQTKEVKQTANRRSVTPKSPKTARNSKIIGKTDTDGSDCTSEKLINRSRSPGKAKDGHNRLRSLEKSKDGHNRSRSPGKSKDGHNRSRSLEKSKDRHSLDRTQNKDNTTICKSKRQASGKSPMKHGSGKSPTKHASGNSPTIQTSEESPTKHASGNSPTIQTSGESPTKNVSKGKTKDKNELSDNILIRKLNVTSKPLISESSEQMSRKKPCSGVVNPRQKNSSLVVNPEQKTSSPVKRTSSTERHSQRNKSNMGKKDVKEQNDENSDVHKEVAIKNANNSSPFVNRGFLTSNEEQLKVENQAVIGIKCNKTDKQDVIDESGILKEACGKDEVLDAEMAKSLYYIDRVHRLRSTNQRQDSVVRELKDISTKVQERNSCPDSPSPKVIEEATCPPSSPVFKSSPRMFKLQTPSKKDSSAERRQTTPVVSASPKSGLSNTPRSEKRRMWNKRMEAEWEGMVPSVRNVKRLEKLKYPAESKRRESKRNDRKSLVHKVKRLEKLKYPTGSGNQETVNNSTRGKQGMEENVKNSESCFSVEGEIMDKAASESCNQAVKTKTSQSRGVETQTFKDSCKSPSKNLRSPSKQSASEIECESPQRVCTTLVWQNAKGSTPKRKKKKIKLNHSWSVLSDRSVNKLLHDSDSESNFEGFDEGDVTGHSSLCSDASFIEIDEVELEDSTDHEWELEQEKPEDDQEENDVVRILPRMFSSPNKRSDSSWDTGFVDFIDTHLSSKQTTSQKQDVPPDAAATGVPLCSPRRRKRLVSIPENTTENQLHRRKKRRKDEDEFQSYMISNVAAQVDEDIQFNFASPNKRKSKKLLKNRSKGSSKNPRKSLDYESCREQCQEGSLVTRKKENSERRRAKKRERSEKKKALKIRDNSESVYSESPNEFASTHEQNSRHKDDSENRNGSVDIRGSVDIHGSVGDSSMPCLSPSLSRTGIVNSTPDSRRTSNIPCLSPQTQNEDLSNLSPNTSNSRSRRAKRVNKR